MSLLGTINNSPGPIRDPDYYFEDGNCVLQVGDYLFNLHRTILRKRSAFFRQMFSLPQPAVECQSADGDNDSHPIVCDDSIEAFRAWCWALYAGIGELMEDNAAGASLNEEMCAHIGLLAYKYECVAIENWAQKTLLQKLGAGDYVVPDGPHLAYLLHVSTNCNWPPSLQELVEKLLLRTVSRGPIQLRRVLEIAENVGSRKLAARAYYHYLCSQKWTFSLRERRDRHSGHVTPFPLANIGTLQLWGVSGLSILTDAQELCLYRGFISLSALRDQLRSMPEIERSRVPPTCFCLDSYRKLWSEHAQKLFEDDSFNGVIEFLVEMKRRLSIDSWAGKYHTGGLCACVQLRNEINSFLDGFDASLTRFFPAQL